MSGHKATDAAPAPEVAKTEAPLHETKNTEEKNVESNSGQINTEAIKKALEQANKLSNSTAVFGYHEETHRVTIKIIDKDTDEVIKEFPPEKMLDMVAKTWELLGLLVDERR